MFDLNKAILCFERSWQFDIELIDVFRDHGVALQPLMVTRGENNVAAKELIINGLAPVIFMTPNPIIALGEYGFMRELAATGLPVVFYNPDPPDLTCHFIPDGMSSLATLLASPTSAKFWKKYVNSGPSAITTFQPMTPAVQRRLNDIQVCTNTWNSEKIDIFVPVNYRWFGYTPEEFDPIFGNLPIFFQRIIDNAVGNVLSLKGFHSTDAFDCELNREYSGINEVSYRQLLRMFTYRLNLTKRKNLFQTLKNFPVLVSSNVEPTCFRESNCRAKWIPTNLDTSVDFFLNSRAILSMSYIEDLIHDRVTTAFACGAVPFVEFQEIYHDMGKPWSLMPGFSWHDDSLEIGIDDILSRPNYYDDLGKELNELAEYQNLEFSSQKLVGLLNLVSDPYVSGGKLKEYRNKLDSV